MQVAVFDLLIGPDRVQQFVLADDTVTVVDQLDQQIEGAVAEGHAQGVDVDFAPVAKHLHIAETQG